MKTAGENSKTKQAGGIDERRLKEAGIQERFKDTAFNTLKIPKQDDIRANAKMIYKYAKNMKKHLKEGTGLILSGGYGTMKTTLAVCVLRYYLENGGNGLFIPMCSMIDNLYSMKARSIEEWVRFETRLRNTPLLVIDDLGGEDTSAPWVLSKVNSILTERYNRRKTVIITTNFTKEDLQNTYSGRLIDRLKSTNFYITFNGASKRTPLDLKELQE